LQPCKALRRSSNQKTSTLLKAFSFYASPPLLAMSMLQQHHNDHQFMADSASQALQHELIGLNQDTGHYHIFYDGSWRLCSIQDPYTIAEILAARQQGKVLTLLNASPMIQRDHIDMLRVNDQQLSRPYVESPQSDYPHNQYVVQSTAYQVSDNVVLY
jgi:hypothetical protein